MNMVSEKQPTPFVKELAANSKRTRDTALDSVKIYLTSQKELSEIELLKLWKGIYYCMWMSDRPLVQQTLANSLAQLVYVQPVKRIIPFLRAFWQTMQREWTNIDVLRMDKFLLLTRRYFCVSLEILKKHEWNENLVDEMLQLLAEIPCNVMDRRIPNGLRYHLMDIYIDELEKLGYLEKENEAPVDKLLKPLHGLADNSPTKNIRIKAKEVLKDIRLSKLKEENQVIESEEWNGFQD